MSPGWREAYSELKDYITKNPAIEIGKNIVAIPGDVRPEFYRLFDTVRVAFLKEKHGNLLDEATPLIKSYAEAGQEMTESLGLPEIKVTASLNWFLNDPVNGLIRSIFDTLFDLLKGKIDTSIFEYAASINIENSFNRLFRLGYTNWVFLSLVNLVAPDRALTVPTEDARVDTTLEEGGEAIPGLREEPIKSPEEAKLLSLEHIRDVAFIVPDIIVHSPKADRYVSIRSELFEAKWRARQISDKREWQSFRTVAMPYEVIASWPDLSIYADDNAENLALVADFGRFCRPDIIIECMEQADWYQKGGLKRVKENHAFFKPRLGSYVISRLQAPGEALRELMPEPMGELEAEQATEEPAPEEKAPVEQPNIHILTVGYDHSRLTPIIEALLPDGKVSEETGSQ